MKVKYWSLSILISLSASLSAQFDGIVGSESCQAIRYDDVRFVEWATGCTVTRGYLNIANQSLGLVSYGTESNAVGKVTTSTTDVVSLGDGGSAILTFQTPIVNGAGVDFAVFENALDDYFLELAFVEVSSDGEHFFRFPAISNTPTDRQIGTYGTLDASKIHNLAGKYRVGWGTPFDLDDLPDEADLDKNNVRYIKIVDVVGSITPEFATRDFYGNIVNDPYPTLFASGGFDLAGVGVIHNQRTLSLAPPAEMLVSVYPNPFADYIIVNATAEGTAVIYDLSGKPVLTENVAVGSNRINTSALHQGVYLLKLGLNAVKLVK